MEDDDLIYAVTGHRPDKLGGYEPEWEERRINYAISIIPKYKPQTVIIGMALGWDFACAHACVRLDIPWIAAVPFKGQELRWRKEQQEIYHWLLSKATTVKIVCEGGYHLFKMNKRNEWMVDLSHRILALHDGSRGGTWNCIEYAKKKQVPVLNVWPGWERIVEEVAA